MVVTVSCDEDDGEVGEGVLEEELVDKPGINMAINYLAIFGEVWFLTAGPAVSIPMILAELPERKNCGSFFKKHICHESVQFFDMYRCLFFC